MQMIKLQIIEYCLILHSNTKLNINEKLKFSFIFTFDLYVILNNNSNDLLYTLLYLNTTTNNTKS